MEAQKLFSKNDFSLDKMVESLAKNYYYSCDDLFSKRIIHSNLSEARKLFHKGSFREAKIGKNLKKKKDTKIRGDSICWIEEWSGDLKAIYQHYESVSLEARRSLFLSVKRFEAHFACYPAGSFYIPHVDRHRTSPQRLLSSVLYLGPWKKGEGGELVLYGEEGEAIKIEPKQGRWVVFDSSLEHEVRKTKIERWSLTSWFRDDLIQPYTS